MTDPVLSQLVSVESDLTEQVEQLESQLTQLQTKHQSLRTVIELFEKDGVAPTSNNTKSTQAKAKATKSTKPTARKSATGSKAKASPRKVSTQKAKTTSKTAQSKTPSKAKTKRTTKQQTPGRKKKDGRAATWQKHVQSQYRDLALPESVSSVLRSQPTDVFTIADVMSSIFKEDMPRTSYLKARNRISNILSAGARDGTWYRGRNGRYSQSESVTKIK
ncbi:MAG: hypothetical protein AAGL17_04710 [Cyanobacteria bacterium J06576_12]